ncbi:unnamed protein product [Prorocentrum cordatum]|uniref:Uncharacterized protein n=1 Tax=Prorocentrum cordatum TaxID=2364126 RepID=A0ABN9WFZ4_9DINO|nr:unnamed protein product [Polarella glacialis]
MSMVPDQKSWNISPKAKSIADSPWNQEVEGHVMVWTGEGGTCRVKSIKQGQACFFDGVLDSFWMYSRMAGVFEDVQSFEDMPYLPCRPTRQRSNKPWAACDIHAVKMSKQCPIVRPPPVMPSKTAEFPELEQVDGQDKLDQARTTFCEGAEAEPQYLFGWSEARAEKYPGRGTVLEIAVRQLVPRLSSPLADRGPARARRWAAGELAWLGRLVCFVLRGHPEAELGEAATHDAGTVLTPSKTDNYQRLIANFERDGDDFYKLHTTGSKWRTGGPRSSPR